MLNLFAIKDFPSKFLFKLTIRTKQRESSLTQYLVDEDSILIILDMPSDTRNFTGMKLVHYKWHLLEAFSEINEEIIHVLHQKNSYIKCPYPNLNL